ncbi:MAG: pantoate--beta-alanine ligase [Microthrixaceae bacterium]|nr:pantoate--beta-alanine ligase [Microthrixaceae bacterium]
MRTLRTIPELRALLSEARADGSDIGLVPTMGYLHDGHTSLVRRAAAECDQVVTTIFVNPLQFAPGEDLDAYPRDPAGDAEKASAAGTTVLFCPEPDEMYPTGADDVLTVVTVGLLGQAMEGESRPTHFAGVCTVVAKLFNIVGPCRAYFGEKDYQQLASIRRMAADLSFPVEVVGCPTLREPDGLAMSSRNAYLSERERSVAPVLHEALIRGARLILGGETDASAVRAEMARAVRSAPLGELDYVAVADPDTLQPVERCDPGSRLFGAIRFGRARLIDNIAAGEATDAG